MFIIFVTSIITATCQIDTGRDLHRVLCPKSTMFELFGSSFCVLLETVLIVLWHLLDFFVIL